jgi:amidase
LGHHVEQADIPFDQEQASKEMVWIWFFGFHRWLDQLGSRTGRTPGPDTLEPITWETYKFAKTMDPYRFLDGLDWLNASRRKLGAFFTRHDVLLTPTCAETAPPLGPYGMNIRDMSLIEWMVHSSGRCSTASCTTWPARPPCRCRSRSTPTACRSALSSAPARPRITS